MAGLETSSDDDSDAEVFAFTPANKSSSKRGSSAVKSRGSSSSSSGKKPKKNKKNTKLKTRTHEEDFETAIVGYLKDASSRNRAQVTVASKTVALAEDFKRMTDALGSKIKAAHACDAFVQFLDKKERKQLKYYAAEQASSDSSESLDE